MTKLDTRCNCGVPKGPHGQFCTSRDPRRDLYNRLLLTYRAAKDTDQAAAQARLDHGAMLDTLIRAGAPLSEIGAVLGISKQAVGKAHRKYLEAAGREHR